MLVLGAAASPSWSRAPITRFRGALDGVSAVSANYAWAVGDFTTAHGTRQILHWNGASWAAVPSPDPGRAAFLTAVSARSRTDAWAAGGAASAALLLRWNGRAWARVPSPAPDGARVVDLAGVSTVSASDAWAVGSYCLSTPCFFAGPAPLHSLILHWNGRAWKIVPSPDPGGRFGTVLNAVTGLSASNAWAVGTYGINTTNNRACPDCPGQKSFVLHWNGSTWAQVASPSRGVPPASDLLAVTAVSRVHALAVGWSVFDIPDEQRTLALRWNGTTWTHTPTPSPGPSGNIFAYLAGVSATSPVNAWAVGSDQAPGQKMLVLRWNGSTWTRVPAPSPRSLNGSVLSAVSALSPASAWAVGSNGRTLVLRWNGTTWTRS